MMAISKRIHNFISAYSNAILRYYDHALYLFFAPILGKHFFANDHAMYIKIFSIYAMGYFAKPLGGILLGYIGDRFGRKQALHLSLLCVAIVTCCIGLLPSYHQIGIIASFLLLIFRILQGIFMGGSVGMVYIFENSTTYKNFSNSIFCLSYSIGIFLASLSSDFLYWRIPFLLQSLFALIIVIYSSNIDETHIPTDCKESLTTTLKSHTTPIIKAFLISGSLSGLYKFFFVFMCTYLTQKNINGPWNCKLSTLFLLMSMIVTPFISLWIDIIGHAKKIMLLLYLWLIVFLWLYVYDPLNLNILIISGLIVSALEVIGAPIINTFFDKSHRCLGTSTAYSAASFVFSSTVPLLSIMFEKWVGNEKGMFIYPTILSVLGIMGILLPILFRRI